ncbi:hypothetical protein [Streptomyces pacificus]|uniref:Lipoprotein n=1 Tax=Streptomyces pacificus TaxID=2705029 RepID=A0A6A0AUL7_9ACTN|nr:hypothetical protein [Streptomyces pacificus]GFH36620.1 hypothetical protein SCWH03_28510 [Streptomyces pacificus]
MRTRTIPAAILTAALALTGCSSSEETTDEPGLTAQSMVDQLSDLYPLPNPRDNTGSCNDGKGHKDSCQQLITTDPVSVYELATAESAATWTKKLDGVNDSSAVQAGRFMLVWKADYPSDEDAVAEMTAKAQDLAAKEK